MPFQTPDEIVPNVDTPVADSAVNAPVEGVVAPTVVPLIVPPVMATELAFWDAMVPRPRTVGVRVVHAGGVDEPVDNSA